MKLADSLPLRVYSSNLTNQIQVKCKSTIFVLLCILLVTACILIRVNMVNGFFPFKLKFFCCLGTLQKFLIPYQFDVK